MLCRNPTRPSYSEIALIDVCLHQGILANCLLWLEAENCTAKASWIHRKNIFGAGRDRSRVPSHASQTLFHWAIEAWYFKAWNILKINSGRLSRGEPGDWVTQKNRSTGTPCRKVPFHFLHSFSHTYAYISYFDSPCVDLSRNISISKAPWTMMTKLCKGIKSTRALKSTPAGYTLLIKSVS